jgi:hypothetical protein
LLRETAVVDDGVVLTGKLDRDSLPRDAAAKDVKRAPPPARPEVRFGGETGYVLLSGGASFADVTRVAS